MNTTHCGLCWKQSQTQGKLLAWLCDCHAIRMKTTEDGLEILKINGWLKIEKPLQILRFLRFGEYMEKSACMFLKPYRLTIPAWSVWSVWKEAGLLFFRCESIIQLDKLGFDEAVNDEKSICVRWNRTCWQKNC